MMSNASKFHQQARDPSADASTGIRIKNQAGGSQLGASPQANLPDASADPAVKTERHDSRCSTRTSPEILKIELR